MNSSVVSGTATNGQVVLGLWPIAGITSGGVTKAESEATISAAIESGINWFDTAFSYGYEGESDRALGRCIAGRREQFGIIGKAGQRWTAERKRIVDCSPATLIRDAEDSLARIGIEYFDLFMLHAVDPHVDLRTSAEAMQEIKQRGLAREIGICNVDVTELDCFRQVVHPFAVQHSLNMLQRDILSHLVPYCSANDIQVHVYWVLMKGILAGRIGRDHEFAEGDSRPKYDIYKGEYRERTHRIVGRLGQIAEKQGLTIAQLCIGWALSQAGVNAALIGAKRPEQIRETSASRPLTTDVLAQVEAVCESEGIQTGSNRSTTKG